MKKAFISIYVLLILLVFGLTISFIYEENETNFDATQALYNKKIAMYEAESFLNILVAEKNINTSVNHNDLLRVFDHRSEITIASGDSNTLFNQGKNAKVINIRASYKGSVSYAILTYKLDDKNKIVTLYKRAY